jgi:hypothetical protein
MCSPIWSTLAEMYLKFFDELTIRHWTESGETSYHKSMYRTSPSYPIEIKLMNFVTHYMNNIHKHFQFKLTGEGNNNINYFDLSIHRHNSNLHLRIYRKPVQKDTTIHFTSNHPLEHKLAAYICYIDRMIALPFTEEAKQQEWNIFLNIARNYIFSLQIIHSRKNKPMFKT